jgi:D-lactate dehydrogenase
MIPANRLITDPLRTLAYGTDAGFYRLIPGIVVKVESEEEVAWVLAGASDAGLTVTFRAGGTSLSGQAVSDSVLVLLGKGWRGYAISPDGSTIRLQPGVVGAHANAYLAPLGRKIGPDPASINAAMVGGIVANNASGMCCGTAQNSYRTLEGMRVMFADGTLLDTRDPASRAEFLGKKREMADAVAALASDVRSNEELSGRIRRKFAMKNTTGYSLNALVDFTDPVEIIQHLMVGSEGTLGFIADVTYRTVPELPHKASALMVFEDIRGACAAVAALKGCRVDAVELMDRQSLRSVEEKEGMPAYLRSLDGRAAALLVETRAETRADLLTATSEATSAAAPFPQLIPCTFTENPDEYGVLWNIRKGLFPSVGAMRATGTTCIIEDVAFPLPRLADAVADLRALFAAHGYDEAIIFGHALEGNIHFVFNQDFNAPSEIARYARFIDDLTRMVVEKYDGSLKAEHGTGRNMAPFVEREWGAQAYAIMRRIKAIFDPEGLLNPGVILNDDPRAHLKNLKPLPAADPLIDKCIECGFCEPQCPSRDLTLTPRQRIVAFREIARLGARGDQPGRMRSFTEGFAYAGDETCATDGLCSLACPVGIDTGKMVKALRYRGHSPAAHALASLIADHMGGVTAAMRGMLAVVEGVRRVVGDRALLSVSTLARRCTGNLLPLWNPSMPGPAPRIPASGEPDSRPAVVYFPSCINRTMGTTHAEGEAPALTRATVSLLEKGGYRVIYPEKLEALCCGMPFDSKGFKAQGLKKARELEAALLAATGGGERPVLVDMSPCLYRMKETLDRRLRLYDPVEFILTYLAPRLEFHRKGETVALHATCSATKMGLAVPLKKLAEMCVSDVVVPDGVGCCGWAGDRGFTVPELNASALAPLGAGIPAGCKEGFSTSRTCEIGLSLHGGIPYSSIIYLVDRCTTAKGMP